MKIELSVAAIKQQTGLTESVILELLDSGWSYIEELGKPIRWEKTCMIAVQYDTHPRG